METEQIKKICQQHHAALLSVNGATIRVAVANAPSTEFAQALAFASSKRADIECWSPERLEKYLQDSQQNPLINGDRHSVVELINQALERAVARRASDIHIEPGENGARVRLRVDGVLQPLSEFSSDICAPVIARLKILGNLDIAERRLPQDGQFDTEIQGEKLSLRLSTLPCRGGEKAVLRLLRQESRPLTPQALGMAPAALAAFLDALAKPQGLILVTGPTGSGKTLTLYSALSTLNHPGVNIACVEDPVEIPLEGLTQTQIHPKAGLTFQKVLRALLRQDPDIIMIGEIRDGETAEIALKAAQTGHLVLSTLHTQSTAQTLTRLEQMGTARWQIASALALIIAQRLVRRLCPHCRKPASAQILPDTLSPEPVAHWLPVGCERCYSGYYGRVALFELMPIDSSLQNAIIAGESVPALEQICRERGMITLFEDGVRAVQQGLTTFDELWRVLGIPDEK
ncbi:type II secretion system protein GspE [Tenebrionicola larvae]|uniref:Type II secretion system protein GspE n=1 Tax=Tenebrionicola larvae TaxID=2815733 RepID=A0A949Q235_9ENTR|nr:type II secretion system protein GspE [Tenebrionicola larvae]MBV5094377.1 type II secretion system protein GspE [Tenebrionicola larvae]